MGQKSHPKSGKAEGGLGGGAPSLLGEGGQPGGPSSKKEPGSRPGWGKALLRAGSATCLRGRGRTRPQTPPPEPARLHVPPSPGTQRPPGEPASFPHPAGRLWPNHSLIPWGGAEGAPHKAPSGSAAGATSAAGSPVSTMKGGGAALLLLALALCWAPARASDNEFFLEFLQTLLVGSVDDLYTGPLAAYKINPDAKAAMSDLKACIDNLAPVHKSELVKLLVMVLDSRAEDA
ncbi:secretoglobin family 1C member 1 [Monodelphis domestica]|uniref:secretoglobin family 1C member 1 n=1 Tax=Monodelphis domestica TaxID=13616 RepID=UPI0024E20095|nr:secretoglobin family 1C member 1 [Monodelphis domestica]